MWKHLETIYLAKGPFSRLLLFVASFFIGWKQIACISSISKYPVASPIFFSKAAEPIHQGHQPVLCPLVPISYQNTSPKEKA